MTRSLEFDRRPFAERLNVLPRRFRAREAEGIRLNVHVATTGPEPGNWLIAVEDGVCRVFLGSVTTPDARLYTSSDTGADILSGALSVAEAVARRLLHFDGDRELLRRFAACFQLGGAS
jgi:hypothetical protein